MPSNATISVESVSLRFGHIKAIDELRFSANPGRITVLLGPNGAGKTTAIRLITGALTPSTGTVAVLGRNPAGSGGEFVRSSCGVVSAKSSLYDRLSGYDNLHYSASLYGVGKALNVENRIRAAAAKFGIAHALQDRVGGYSTGMKTRLTLARSILHAPALLLLDEPTSGLDPESAQTVLELIRTMTDNGQTVLMCTHLLSEAEGLADEIVMIEAGSTLVAGPPSEISQRYWPDAEVSFTATDGSQLDVLATIRGVKAYQRSENTARITLTSTNEIPKLVSEAVRNGVSLTAVQPFEPSLEDLYFAIRSEAAISSRPLAGVL